MWSEGYPAPKDTDQREVKVELALTAGEYHREREHLEEPPQALALPVEEPAIKVNAHVENLSRIWHASSPKERRAITLAVLDAVYVDVDHQQAVAIQPKADFLPLLAAASPAWWISGKLLHGDPEEARSPYLTSLVEVNAAGAALVPRAEGLVGRVTSQYRRPQRRGVS